VNFVVKGLGMIGTSVGLALAGKGRRLGYDPNPEHAARALQLGAVDGLASPEDEKGAVVFLCGPPSAILAEAQRRDSEADLILDVASVKAPIVAAAAQGRLPFVGGHPLAGCELQGPDAGRADMFVGRPFFLVPVVGREALVLRAEGLVRLLGAVPYRIEAEEHDRLLALTSHLPYLLARALRTLTEAVGEEAKGPAFESLTRPGRSPWSLWKEILELNRDPVRQAWEALVREVEGKLGASD